MDDVISRKAAIEAVEKAATKECARWVIQELPPVETMSINEIANLLAEVFKDTCACNYNGIDEWLPNYCEVPDCICPYPDNNECWKQFIKWRKTVSE